MYLLHRLLILSFLPLWLLAVYFLGKQPDFWWLILLVLILVNVGAVYFSGRRGQFSFWNFFILPCLLTLAGFGFLLFIGGGAITYIFAAIMALADFLLIRQYFIFNFVPNQYQPYSLENLSAYLTVFCAYFLFSVFFGSLILLQYGFIVLAAIFMPLIAALFYNYFWINKIEFAKSRLFLMIIVLIILELALAVSYLPTNYYVDAFILTVASYLMLSLSRQFLLGVLTNRQSQYYIIVAILALLIVMLTAKWF